MSDKRFKQILAAIVILGIIATFTLTGYTFSLHKNASIITFINNEA